MTTSVADERTLESTLVTQYDYIYVGTTLVRMVVTTTVDSGTPVVQTLDFAYDASGTPATVTTGGSTYYYITNLQGDIVAILNSSGTAVVEYTYDAWGKLLTTTGSMASTLGEHNPLRYRGYVYDTETTLYYLQSRYYDPELGRFITTDNPSFLGINGEITSYNLFVYCGNSPVSRYDSGGQFWDTVLDLASIVSDVIEIAVNPGSVVAWGALAADVASLIIPGLTGGGQLVRVVTSSDEVLDAAKYADDIFDGAKQFFSKTDLGQALHKGYDPIQDAVEDSYKLLDEALSEYGSRLRPDGVDFENRIIYELKPYNKRAFKQAAKQAKQYADILGGEWTIVLDMYMK